MRFALKFLQDNLVSIYTQLQIIHVDQLYMY